MQCLSDPKGSRRFKVVGKVSTQSGVTVSPEDVDVLIVGLSVSGREAVRRFKQVHTPGIATLVCLARPDASTGLSLMKAGACHWLSVPRLSPSILARAVQMTAGRGRAFRDTQAKIAELTAYREIAEVLASPSGLHENLKKVLRVLVEYTGSARGIIRFPDERHHNLVLYAAVGPLVKTHPPSKTLAINGPSQAARTLREARVLVEDNVDSDSVGPLVRARLHVPIFVEGEVKAIIGLGAAEPGFFTPQKVELATAVGRELGPLVAAAQLRESLKIERTLREHRDDFISVVSHELRTPMTMMMGFSELLLDGEPDPDTRRTWYEMIHSQTRRLARLIDQMLNVSELQAGHVSAELTLVDLGRVIGEVIEECSSSYPKHSFRLDAPPHELAVMADEDMLKQVLRNLVDNAAKFSPDGGPVDVIVSDHPEKGLVKVAIEDEGIGVMPHDRDRLFQTFSRGSNPEVRTIQGVGLGLYTSKSLCESMGCVINFSKKRRGRGSRFSLDIPMAA